MGAVLVAAAIGGPWTSPAGAATPVRDPSRFACPPGSTTPFTDVAGTTHEADIACALHYELTGGTTATTYSPGTTVSRGQMATFLVRVLGLDGGGVPVAPSAGFVDTVGTPHERSIDAIVALGIAGGTSATTFAPSDPVSRAQMATFLRNTVEVLGMTIPTAPPDAFPDDEGEIHEPAIDAVAVLGIAGGTTPTTYGPREDVTRGSMATFLVRVIDLGIEIGFLPPKVDVATFAALTGPAQGSAVISTTDVPDVLCYEIILEDAAATQSARVLAGGEAMRIPTPQADGFTGGCVTNAGAEGVATDDDASVEVTTASGVVSGQLGRRVVGGVTELDRLQVVPGPGDPEAFGIAAAFTTSEPGVLCASVATVSNQPLTGVHLHQGAAHTNGAVVGDFGPLEPFGVPISCRYSTAADAFAAGVSGFYVDVHTVGFPDGSLRGQLEPAAS